MAAALGLIEFQFVQVLSGDFFGWSYVSERVQKEPPFRNDQIGVRITRMVNVLSTVAARAAINGPFFVDVADAFLARFALPELSFSERDFFADVFGDALVVAETGSREAPLAVNRGF